MTKGRLGKRERQSDQRRRRAVASMLALGALKPAAAVPIASRPPRPVSSDALSDKTRIAWQAPDCGGRKAVIHKIDLTGDYETTIYDVARRLLAETGDRVETRRHGFLSMSGVIGELAKLQVVFAATGPRLVRHKGCISGLLTAEMAEPAHSGISAPDGGSPA